MKIASIILAALMLVLAVMPCTDSAECSDALAHAHTDQSHSEEDEGPCSPFCNCDCCGITIDYFEIKPIVADAVTIPLQENKCYIFNYSFDYSFEFSVGVWNPPKLKSQLA